MGSDVEGRDREVEWVDESQRLVYGVYDLLQVLLLILACFGIHVFRNNQTVAATRRRLVIHSFGYRIGPLGDGWFLYEISFIQFSLCLSGNWYRKA